MPSTCTCGQPATPDHWATCPHTHHGPDIRALDERRAGARAGRHARAPLGGPNYARPYTGPTDLTRGNLARRMAAMPMQPWERAFMDAAEKEFKPRAWSIYPQVQFALPHRRRHIIADFIAVIIGGGGADMDGRLPPAAVIAIELDGQTWHDDRRDERRDKAMERVYGIATWRAPAADNISRAGDIARTFVAWGRRREIRLAADAVLSDAARALEHVAAERAARAAAARRNDRLNAEAAAAYVWRQANPEAARAARDAPGAASLSDEAANAIDAERAQTMIRYRQRLAAIRQRRHSPPQHGR